MSNNWSAATSWDEVCRRAAGRRHWNAVRRFRREHRRWTQVVRLLCEYGFFERGVQARIARELGVSRSTICRDVAGVLHLTRPCECCGSMVPRIIPGRERE